MSTFAHIAFQNFTFVIFCKPKVVPFAVNLGCTHWPEVVSPKPDCFIAYVNASLMKKVLHITK